MSVFKDHTGILYYFKEKNDRDECLELPHTGYWPAKPLSWITFGLTSFIDLMRPK